MVIGSGAKVLGPFKVGNNCRIAAGAVVLDEIPDDCTAVGVPARVVRRKGRKVDALDHVHIPDPISQKFCELEGKIQRLEQQLNEANQQQGENQ